MSVFCCHNSRVGIHLYVVRGMSTLDVPRGTFGGNEEIPYQHGRSHPKNPCWYTDLVMLRRQVIKVATQPSSGRAPGHLSSKTINW